MSEFENFVASINKTKKHLSHDIRDAMSESHRINLYEQRKTLEQIRDFLISLANLLEKTS